MYIVLFPTNVSVHTSVPFLQRHSAWLSLVAAENQARILRDHGYKDVSIEFDETVSCEDGHYYV